MAIVLPSYRHMARGPWESKYPKSWDGLVGAWVPSLGVTGITTLPDVSGYHNDGTLTGGMTIDDWVPGEKGYVLDFDGSNDYVAVPDSEKFQINGNRTLTFVFWMKATVLESSVGPIGKQSAADGNDGYTINTVSTGAIQVSMNGNSAPTYTSATGVIIQGQWHHIVVQMRVGGQVKAHVDQTLVIDTVDGITTVSESNELRIGVAYHVGQYFNGMIGYVLAYNREFTQSDVSLDYANPLAPFQLKRQIFIDEPPPVGGNEGAAMYHHLQNIGAY